MHRLQRGEHPGELVESPASARPVSQPSAILTLQQQVGNGAVARMIEAAGRRDCWSPVIPPWDREPGHRDLIAEEWETLGSVQKFFEKPTLHSYRELRDAFLGRFGLAQDGAAMALKRAIAYYTEGMVTMTFQGSKPFAVHHRMESALRLAEAVLGETFSLRVGGANIRYVRGSDGVMSDHSWGAAIDINGNDSPMTSGLSPGSRRVDMIEAITGTDVTQSITGDKLTTAPKTHQEMLDEAARLQLASDEFVKAFADEESLMQAAYRIASDRGAPTGGPEALLVRMYAAGREDRRDLDAWERKRKKNKKLPAEQRLWDWEPEPVEAGPEQDPGRNELARFVFPIDDGDSSLLWEEEHVETTVDVLGGMGRTFKESFDQETGERVGPDSTFPTDGQLAVHGFMDVPPEVVAALSESKGANLKWLGATAGDTKDYMHFQLRNPPEFY